MEEKITVPIKFNKETRELSLEEAAALAQKGLKFEAIEKDFATLKDLACSENKSVPAYLSDLLEGKSSALKQELLEKCGGNEEIAERLLQLEENKPRDMKCDELYEAFPEIKSLDDLPESVAEGIRLRGTYPLDEYLRYLFLQDKNAKTTLKKQREAEKTSTGSLVNLKGGENPEAQEFLRGLWK